MYEKGYGPSIMDESPAQTAARLRKKQINASVSHMHSAARRIVTNLRAGGQTAITEADERMIIHQLFQYGVNSDLLAAGFRYATKVMRERTERTGGCR